MKMNMILDKETQKELASEGFSFQHESNEIRMPQYIIEAAKRAGKVYDPITNKFVNK